MNTYRDLPNPKARLAGLTATFYGQQMCVGVPVKPIGVDPIAPATTSAGNAELTIRAFIKEIKKEVEKISNKLPALIDKFTDISEKLKTEIAKNTKATEEAVTTPAPTVDPLLALFAKVGSGVPITPATPAPAKTVATAASAAVAPVTPIPVKAVAPVVTVAPATVMPATPAPAKVVAPAAPATAVTAKPAPEKMADIQPWERVNERFSSAVRTILELGWNEKIPVQGTSTEGVFATSASEVVKVRNKNKRNSRVLPETWTKCNSSEYFVISRRQKEFLVREEMNKQYPVLMAQGFSEEDAKRWAMEESRLTFIPLAIYAVAKHLDKETVEEWNLENVRQRIKDKSKALLSQKKSKPTVALTSAPTQAEPPTAQIEATPITAPIAATPVVTPVTEAPISAPVTEPTVDASAPTTAAPVNMTVSANTAVVLDRPIDPLLLVKGCLYGNKGFSVKKQVQRLQKDGYDLGYITRCYSEEHPDGITFNVKPSEVVFLYDEWHLNSWIRTDAKIANLKSGKQAPVTPVDFEMMSLKMGDEEDRIHDLLKSRGFKCDDKLPFDGNETAGNFSIRVAQEQWIPMINYLMASIKGENFYSWRNAKNQERLSEIKSMDEVKPPEQPELPIAPAAESLAEEISVVNEDLQAIFFGEESESIAQPLSIAEEAILLSKAVEIDHSAELAKAVNENPASSEHAGNGSDK